MSDLVAKLRRLASLSREKRETVEDKAYWDGARTAYERAAQLLEEDPLYKGAPDLRDLVREVAEWRSAPYPTANQAIPELSEFLTAWQIRAQAFLDTLPKEATK